MTKVVAFEGTESVKDPSVADEVPVLVPFTRIDAFAIG